MLKLIQKKRMSIINYAILQIILLVSFSFAVSFIFSEYVGVGSAQEETDLPSEFGYSDAATGEPHYFKTSTTLTQAGATTQVAAKSAPGSKPGFLGRLFGVKSAVASHLINGLQWGGLVAGAIQLLGAFGVIDKGLADSLSLSAFAGIMSWQGAHAVSALFSGGTSALPLGVAPLIGLGVGVAVFFATYEKEKKELIKFECLPWEPPLGGQNCEKCNEDPFLPCSEYRCKSLGQACELENKGTNEEICVWKSKNDVNAPKITPWQDALKPQGLRYVPDTSISPPNTGFRILSNEPGSGGCLKAFTRLEFGINADEPAQCRLDFEPKNNYDEMEFLFGESNLFRLQHTEKLKTPENPPADIPPLYKDGTYTLWARCIDANGNGKDSAMVAFRFCVLPGPDATPPQIEGFSIEPNSPVRFEADGVPIEVYTDEPAECRWSRQDKAFGTMENTMNCARETFEINAELNYICSGELTGIQDMQNNEFYFRCRDYSSDGPNVMLTSEKLTLRGTEPLVIESAAPEGTIENSTSVVTVELRVKTAHGADEGKATCYYSETEEEGSFNTPMLGENTFLHTQPIDKTAGNYHFFFRCIDAGGNTAEAETTFTIKVDTQPPKVTRAFRDQNGNKLKIITDEESKCAYSLTNCNYNFDDGLPLIYEDPTKRNVHFTDWDPDKIYYIKCMDFNNKQPPPNECQIIIQGSEF